MTEGCKILQDTPSSYKRIPLAVLDLSANESRAVAAKGMLSDEVAGRVFDLPKNKIDKLWGIN